jgi:hypothetical protein
MVSISELRPGEIVMKYKSEHLIRREAIDDLNWAFAECDKTFRAHELTKSILAGDDLAKAAGADLEAAKADVADLRATHATKAAEYVDMHALERLAGVMRDYVKRSERNEEDRRRSRRINEALSSPLNPTVH